MPPPKHLKSKKLSSPGAVEAADRASAGSATIPAARPARRPETTGRTWTADSGLASLSPGTPAVAAGPRRPGSSRPVLTHWGYCSSSPWRETCGASTRQDTALSALFRNKPSGSCGRWGTHPDRRWSEPALLQALQAQGTARVTGSDASNPVRSPGGGWTDVAHRRFPKAHALRSLGTQPAQGPHRACSWTALTSIPEEGALGWRPAAGGGRGREEPCGAVGDLSESAVNGASCLSRS